MQIEPDALCEICPEEIRFREPVLCWKDPCWIHVHLPFSMKKPSGAGNVDYIFDHVLDAFARTGIEPQLANQYFARLKLLTGRYSSEWYRQLVETYFRLKHKLHDLHTLFRSPGDFQTREQFRTADLATILKSEPDTIAVYIALEQGTYAEYAVLRMHSCAGKPSREYVWYEKRLPRFLDAVDVGPWLIETIARLPKRKQPANLNVWLERFFHFHPAFRPWQSPQNAKWDQKPPIVIIFGAAQKVGYRTAFHIGRKDIIHYARSRSRVTLVGNVDSLYSTQKFCWKFFLLTADDGSARVLEAQIEKGRRIHFGLDRHIVGIIAMNTDVIHAMNVREQDIREICLRRGEELELDSPARAKHKCYNIMRPLH